jgi:hypothetical protein
MVWGIKVNQSKEKEDKTYISTVASNWKIGSKKPEEKGKEPWLVEDWN